VLLKDFILAKCGNGSALCQNLGCTDGTPKPENNILTIIYIGDDCMIKLLRWSENRFISTDKIETLMIKLLRWSENRFISTDKIENTV